MGDEIALRNDPNWADDPAHADDNRWLHRPPTDWAAAERRSDPATPEGCMFRALRDLAAARSRIPAFRANASATCLDLRPPSLFAYRRGGPPCPGRCEPPPGPAPPPPPPAQPRPPPPSPPPRRRCSPTAAAAPTEPTARCWHWSTSAGAGTS